MNEKLSNKKQNILIFMCWLVYTVSYIGRYSYSANQIAIISYYGITKTIAGLVGTFYFISYGIGQVVHGVFCKKYNKQFIISISLLVSAISNIFLFFKPSFVVFKYLWLLNGAFLSILWPTIVCFFGEKLDNNHLKKSIIVMSTTVPAGTIIPYGLSAIFNIYGKFEYAFLTGFIFTLTVGIIWLCFFKKFSNTGVVDINKDNNVEYIDNIKNVQNSRKSLIIVLFIFGFFAIIVNFAKDGLTTWMPNILKDEYNLNDSLSIILTLTLPVLGVFGVVVAAYLNRWIKNYIKLSGVMFTMAFILILVVILLFNVKINLVLTISIILVCFGVLSLLMHGINNVITGFAPLELRQTFPAGALAGIFNGCCYVGSAISSFGIGAIVDGFGSWLSVFIIIAMGIFVAILVSVVFCLFSKIKCKK